MKKFAIALLMMTVVWFACDRTGGMAMHWVYWHTHEQKAQKICHIVSGVEADIMLLGTSRCAYHYVPSIIADSMGMSVYNAGIDGSGNIFFQYATLAHLLRRHTPRMVVLDTGESEFAVKDVDDFAPLALYAPHIGLCAQADSLFSLSGTLGIYRLSHLYRYHSLAPVLIAGLFGHDAEGEDHGYWPLPQPDACPSDPGDVQQPLPTDSLKLHYLRRFIRLCRQHDIHLVLSISPSYSHVDTHYYDALKEVAVAEHITLLDYDTPNLFIEQPELFRDHAHLWDRGARRFTQRFAHDLKSIHAPAYPHNRCP